MRASRREPTTHEWREAAADENQQHHQARDVDADDEGMQIAEVRRLLHGLRHDQQRSHPQPRSDEHQDRDQRAFQSCGDHVYHSLRCRQSSDQNSTKRKASGIVRTSRLPRTLISCRRFGDTSA